MPDLEDGAARQYSWQCPRCGTPETLNLTLPPNPRPFTMACQEHPGQAMTPIRALEDRVAALEAAVAQFATPEPAFMDRVQAETLHGTEHLKVRLTHTGIMVVARDRQEAIYKLRQALAGHARRQADLQWKTKVAEARRAGRETPLKRGSDCPEHGGTLLWLGNGDLMCLQGHFYRLPEPREPATPSRRRKAKVKPEETSGAP